jgi:crotonobetainyl-CoA:carnitine CoA-transferase CaiB-like acyl-CoA transferase
MPGPLDGIRIIDLTTMASGPFATALLGDQGADVIKVEPPGHGDLLRQIGAARGGLSAVFANMNRSKRSLVLNLANPRGVALLERLADSADVFIQNFRPGVVERMGIGEASLRRRNPELIYVSISGFGETGPDAQRRVYDSVMQAYSGFAAHQADPETGEPRFVRNIICDKSTALTVAQAVTAALFARQRGAGGQHVQLSMLHASIAFLWPDGMQAYTLVDPELDADPTAAGPVAPQASLPTIRRTADGYVAISTISNREFGGLCKALERPKLERDSRFAEAGQRARNAAALQAIVEPLVLALSTSALLERLEREDVPHAAVTPLARLHEHPQVVASRVLSEAEHPSAGRLRSPRPVADFERTPSEVRRLAPELGEHSGEILEELGLDADEIARLREAEVVA